MKDWILKDYYRILGVSQDSNKKELKQAYHRLVRENHLQHHHHHPRTLLAIKYLVSLDSTSRLSKHELRDTK